MQTVIYVISTTFLSLLRRRLSRETSPAARREERLHHKQCDIFTFRYISSVLNHTQGSEQICEESFTYYMTSHWPTPQPHPNFPTRPPPPPPQVKL